MQVESFNETGLIHSMFTINKLLVDVIPIPPKEKISVKKKIRIT